MAKLVEEIGKLRQIGADEIYQRTLISREFIDAILKREIDGVSRVKLQGFIKIIKRDFNIDLTELLEYKQEEEKNIYDLVDEPLKEKNTRSIFFYTSIFVLIILLVLFATLSNKEPIKESPNNIISQTLESEIESPQETQVEEQIIEESSTEQIESGKSESKSTSELNQQDTTHFETKKIALKDTLTNIEKVTTMIETHTPKVLHITLNNNSKLWVGIINLENDRKKQHMITDKLEIPLSGKMLIFCAHNGAIFEYQNQEFTFNDTDKLFFLFDDNELTKIDYKQYLHYNKGKQW